MTTATPPSRRPGVAALFGLITPGLGHIYSGAPVRGVVLFLLALITVPLALVAAGMHATAAVLWGLVGIVGLRLLIGVVSVVDAWRAARRQQTFTPGEFNRAGIYALFIIVGLAQPVAAVTMLRDSALEAFVCPTSSMAPTIQPGDRFLVQKVDDAIDRGDVIVFRNPRDRSMRVVQRVVGLPGDTVAVTGGTVTINGQPLPRQPIAQLAELPEGFDGEAFTETCGQHSYVVLLHKSAVVPDLAPITVPPGTCFTLGDNRDRTVDGRSFGCVPQGDIIGAAEYLVLPAGSWSRFGLVDGD